MLDSSKVKEFADDNFRFDENGRNFSKWVENTVGKGEIACSKQFLLFPQCFQKACFPGASKSVIVWEWVNYFLSKYSKPIPTQWHLLTPLGNMPFEDTVGKGEIACNDQFLLYPQLFLPL